MSNLFPKLLEMSLTGSFVILGVLILRLAGGLPRRYVCMFWLFAALRLAVPFALPSSMSLIPAELISAPAELFAASAPSTQPETAPAAASFPLTEALSWVWLAGCAAVAVFGAVSYLRLRRRTALAVKTGERGVWECAECMSPFVLGFFRPRIILPAGLDDGRRQLILMHERAHIEAHDQLKKPLAYLILAIHWFNPLVWAGYVLFCRDIELACDERVVCDLDAAGRKSYSHALLDFAGQERTMSCPLAFGELDIRCRVRRVLWFERPARIITAIAFIGAVYWVFTTLTNPLPPEPDLSLANYRQIANMAYQYDELYAEVSDGETRVTKVISGPALGEFLSSADWEQTAADPDSIPALKMRISFSGRVLELYAIDSFRVRTECAGDERWYAIDSGDYQDLVALSAYPAK